MTRIFESFSRVWQRLRIGTHSYKKISSGRHMATQPMINIPLGNYIRGGTRSKREREFSHEYTTKEEG